MKKININENKNKNEHMIKDPLLCKIMNTLPQELMDWIKQYIPTKFLVFVNKSYYLDNHIFLLNAVLFQNRYDKYVRNLISSDNSFVFQTMLREHDRHNTNKKYFYKNVEYKNYYYFLIDFCIENEASNCRNALNTFLLEAGLCQNRDKKNRWRNVRWKT